MSKVAEKSQSNSNNFFNGVKFFVYSLIGIIIFFVPITINNTSSILLDHFVTWISQTLPLLTKIFIMLIIIAGAIYPFIKGTWKRSTVDIIFSMFKVLGLIIGIMIIFNIGPTWLLNDKTGQYVFNFLVIPVGITVPAGGGTCFASRIRITRICWGLCSKSYASNLENARSLCGQRFGFFCSKFRCGFINNK